ncbi:MAG: endonuclease/exonuclease/phosphatase family protein [Sandaracinaceae bacterium]
MGRLALACLLVACATPAPDDAGPDARDGGAIDGGATDAGATDAGATDAGGLDDAGPDGGGSDAAMPGARATVLTLNLHCLSLDGTPYASNDARFAAIAETVAAEGVDVLLLQEVCDDGTTDAAEALRAALAAAGAGDYEAHVAFAHVAWEGTPEEARESVAVMARSIARPSVIDHQAQGGLRRVAAAADVPTPLGTLRAASVHLDFMDAAVRRAQAREAAAVVLSEAFDDSLPALVGGDLNATRGSDAHRAFGDLGFLDASQAAGGSRIDHVFSHRSAPLRAVEARRVFDTPATAVSDHPGVLVRFEAATPDAVSWTRVIAAHDPGFGHGLWLRGSVAPLSWDAGWPMHALAPGRWRFVTSELMGSVELKTLVDDTTWQTGDDVTAEAGTEVTLSPSF